MRVAIISDLHGDLPQLHEALKQAKHFECNLVLCAGDLVDGEPFPEEVIGLLRDRGIPTIRGNHDRWAIGAGRAIEPNGGRSGAPYDASGFGLSRAAVKYLAELPTYWGATLDGTRVAMHHGRPGSDMKGVYPDLDRAEARTLLEAAGADTLFLGHTHEAFVAQVDEGKLIANPGALWSGAGGTFGILDTTERSFLIFRVGGGEVQVPRVCL
jgi:putative phosphoesterase